MDAHLLSGTDRLEFWDRVGRQFRMGAATALRASNMQRFRDAVQAGDISSGESFLNYIYGLDAVMVSLTSEWSLRWPQVMLECEPKARVVEVTSRANELWRSTTGSGNDEASEATWRFLQTKVSGVAHGDQVCIDPSELISALTKMFETTRREISRDGAAAITLAEQYLVMARRRHDLISQYLWAYPTVVIEVLGEAAAQRGVMASFNACSFQEQMWKLFASLSPIERTAFLAEHMRAHFSGPQREGEVNVIEEADRFKIICDPCGSGGAMRRSGWHGSMGFFSSLSPLTWNKSWSVPAYCAHCAVNQINSTKVAGHPLWVTEFNPDPSKPCCWTVFKSPALIPAEHYI